MKNCIFYLEIFLLAFAVLCLLHGIKQSQLGPHRVRTSVMGRVVYDEVLTNSTYVAAIGVTNLPGSTSPQVVFQTNHFWTVNRWLP